MNPAEIEEQYQDIMKDLEAWTPEGIVHVDLEYLQSLGLLAEVNGDFGQPKHPLTHYFHVIETAEKITLFNDQFVVWIVPQIFDHEPVTFALVGILAAEAVHLELVFATSGVYNTSKIVLKVLERVLEDIQENEEILDRLTD
jgi:hypothetical protein